MPDDGNASVSRTSDAANDLAAFVAAVKRAISSALAETPDIVVTQATLEVKAVTSSSARAGGFTWGPVQIGGSYTRTEIAILSLTLTPVPSTTARTAFPADALTQAIASISAAAREAATAEPRFALSQAKVYLNLGVTADGNLTVVVGGDISSENVHTLELVLASRT